MRVNEIIKKLILGNGLRLEGNFFLITFISYYFNYPD